MRHAWAFALTLLATAATASPAPGQPGHVLPWNRPARDTVVDLAPGGRGVRIELTGRLVADDGSAMPGVVVYVYHADARGAGAALRS